MELIAILGSSLHWYQIVESARMERFELHFPLKVLLHTIQPRASDIKSSMNQCSMNSDLLMNTTHRQYKYGNPACDNIEYWYYCEPDRGNIVILYAILSQGIKITNQCNQPSLVLKADTTSASQYNLDASPPCIKPRRLSFLVQTLQNCCGIFIFAHWLVPNSFRMETIEREPIIISACLEMERLMQSRRYCPSRLVIHSRILSYVCSFHIF